MRPPKIPAESFVRVWQAASSLSDVCEALGLNKETARSRATFLRRKGVPLKSFGVFPGPLDYAALADLARSLKPEDAS